MDGRFDYARRVEQETSTKKKDTVVLAMIVLMGSLVAGILIFGSGHLDIEDGSADLIVDAWGVGP